MPFGERAREGVGLGIDDEIDVALAIEGDLFGAMFRHRLEAHPAEHRVKHRGIGMGELDELETIRAHRVCIRDQGRRRVMREWSHVFLLNICR